MTIFKLETFEELAKKVEIQYFEMFRVLTDLKERDEKHLSEIIEQSHENQITSILTNRIEETSKKILELKEEYEERVIELYDQTHQKLLFIYTIPYHNNNEMKSYTEIIDWLEKNRNGKYLKDYLVQDVTFVVTSCDIIKQKIELYFPEENGEEGAFLDFVQWTLGYLFYCIHGRAPYLHEKSEVFDEYGSQYRVKHSLESTMNARLFVNYFTFYKNRKLQVEITDECVFARFKNFFLQYKDVDTIKNRLS